MRTLYYVGSLAAVLMLAGCVTPGPPPAMPGTQAAPAQTAPSGFAAVTAVAPRPRATGTPEDARRHMIRGEAAIEMAKTVTDLALAEDEFRMATEIEPTLAGAWFNLGAVQARTGHYSDAIDSYQHYLDLSPQAADAQKIRDELIKLQFRAEQEAKVEGRAGIWIADDGAAYSATVDGDRMTLHTGNRRVPESEILSTYTLVGSVPIGLEADDYQLLIQSNRIKGLWSRPAMPADRCTVPAESAELTGTLDDRQHTMVLNYVRTTYKAVSQMSLLSNDYCSGVTATDKKNVEMKLYGPLPKGGLGVTLVGLDSWWDGGMSMVKFGWQGRLAIRVAAGAPAYDAGLRDMDEVLSIDGVAVKTISAGQAVWLLHGAPGTPVSLTVARKDVAAPIAVTMKRVTLPNVLKPNTPWFN